MSSTQHSVLSTRYSVPKELIQLWIKAALLFGLGIYFVYNIASGNIPNYVNARFAWLSYVAAALFLLIGVFSAIHLLRDHGHDRRSRA